MRLIDADKMNLLLGISDRDIYAKRMLDHMDTVDAAPVTRCKDCKFSHADGHGRTCEGYWFELSEYAVSVKDDAFCSYGERREDA